MSGSDTETWAIIAGGGTAGHVNPGLAIAEALVSRGHSRSSLHYVGSARGSDGALVEPTGIPFTLLPGRGIARQLTWDNLGAAAGLVRAQVHGLRLIRRLRPSVVVGLGGYASVACCLAAAVHRIPIVIAEQNAVPGAANRLVGRWATTCAVSFPDTDLPNAVVTGNPVRPAVLAVERDRDRAEIRGGLGLGPDDVMVLAFGGSLGARRINEAVIAALPRLCRHAGMVVRHVIGRRDWSSELATEHLCHVAIEYEDRMAEMLAAADLVVARAGASTVAEVTVIGVPSILVPLPSAPGDHQTANARTLADAGAAVLVPDAELTGERLADEVDLLVADVPRRATMEAAAVALARRGAADHVAQLVEAAA